MAADVHLWSVENYGKSMAAHKKILIVDDSPAEVKLMQGLLEREGYWPVGLNDSTRVEETITAERPNVILLDVVMPNRNGFQICRDLKGNADFSIHSGDLGDLERHGERQVLGPAARRGRLRDEALHARRASPRGAAVCMIFLEGINGR